MEFGPEIDDLEDLLEGVDETEVEFLEDSRSAALPIKHWSFSSLMSFLRNPLAWYKRYVEKVYDTPSTPSSIVGRAGHVALQHFYSGIGKGGAIDLGLEYLRDVPDFEINFRRSKTKRDKKEKRLAMEREYLRAIGFYLEKPPKYDVVGVEVKATTKVEGLSLPVRAISDLVVRSAVDKKALDIVDHKFVDYFSTLGREKSLFIIQAIFNYYTVKNTYEKPVRRFILQECRKKRNMDGSKQMRRYIIEYDNCKQEFKIFQRLLRDATSEISRSRLYLPNPTDIFEGENSFDIYRLGLANSE